MSRTIELDFFYPHSPEAVWRALTDRALLATWLMPNDFEPRIGHRFEFRMPPKPGFDGVIRCEVKEIEAPRRLVYSWGSAWGSESTVVTFTLEPEAGGTRLRFSHAGFHGVKGFLLSLMMRPGWKKKLGKVVPGMLGPEKETREVA